MVNIAIVNWSESDSLVEVWMLYWNCVLNDIKHSRDCSVTYPLVEQKKNLIYLTDNPKITSEINAMAPHVSFNHVMH